MRDELIRDLLTYRGQDVEMQYISPMVDLLQSKADCYFRTCFDPGHITGSGLLINQKGDKVLLNHHGIYDCWLSFGGHADGDSDIRRVAKREVIEESGIENVRFVTTDIFDVDIHSIAANLKKNEPPHSHFDIVFLFQCETENFKISDESNELRWCSFEEAQILCPMEADPRMVRLLSKWKKMFL